MSTESADDAIEGPHNVPNVRNSGIFLADTSDSHQISSKPVSVATLVSGNLEQLIVISTDRKWIPFEASLTASTLLLQKRLGSKIQLHSISVPDILDIIALQSAHTDNTSKPLNQEWNHRPLVRKTDDSSHSGRCFGIRVAGDCRGSIFRTTTVTARAEWVGALRKAAASAVRERMAEERAKLSIWMRARESAEVIREHR